MASESDKQASGGDLSRHQDAAMPGVEEAKELDEPAEEAEREEGQKDRDDSVPTEEAPARDPISAMERGAKPLQEGNVWNSPLGPLPIRSLAAMATLVVVAVVVFLILWSLFGTLGLVLGWLPALALGLFAGREVGLRSG